MKRFFFILLSIGLASSNLLAQIAEPVTWSFWHEKAKDGQLALVLSAKIDPGWHVYDLDLPTGGPIPTSFAFMPSADYQLIGKPFSLSKPVKAYDPNFQMNIAWFNEKVSFKQKIKLTKAQTHVQGTVEYMVCNDKQCLPPTEVEFSIPVKGVVAAKELVVTLMQDKKNSNQNQKSNETSNAIAANQTDSPAITVRASIATANQTSTDAKAMGNWYIFILGFGGGLLALLTPCVYSMIPLTVSFFMKSGRSGRKDALIYALSIVIIYVGIGLIITKAFGAGALNELASNALVNLFFFALFVVFAISFFGAFEISLPSSWVNKSDKLSNKGGLIGIFFMAFTLALVSFSCTGPIIGTLLVQAASAAGTIGPLVGMAGFSMALALPFSLFALFPKWLGGMPKSGGWLNSIKVVLGFLELALALKFLSNADLAYHWGILSRPTFLTIWIVIFIVLGCYLLGKIRFAHDSEITHVSIPRLFLSIAAFGFAVYMVPGLWGSPLKAISAFPPPMATQEFDLSALFYSNQAGNNSVASPSKNKKHGNLLHSPYGLDAFYDYAEALTHAKKIGKPLLIDFTGHSCINCRKMESTVWADQEVLRLIKNEYVLVSLYVDDRTKLAQEEQYITAKGKKINTIGKQNSALQEQMFQTNSQPYYVLLNPNDEQMLGRPRAFDQDIPAYIDFLKQGIVKFNQR